MISKLVCQGILIGIGKISNAIESKDIQIMFNETVSIDENMTGMELIRNNKNCAKSQLLQSAYTQYTQSDAIDKFINILRLFDSFASQVANMASKISATNRNKKKHLHGNNKMDETY